MAFFESYSQKRFHPYFLISALTSVVDQNRMSNSNTVPEISASLKLPATWKGKGKPGLIGEFTN